MSIISHIIFYILKHNPSYTAEMDNSGCLQYLRCTYICQEGGLSKTVWVFSQAIPHCYTGRIWSNDCLLACTSRFVILTPCTAKVPVHAERVARNRDLL